VNKPLFLYDADCRFCRGWVDRWRAATGDRVDYASFDEAVRRDPDLGKERTSVKLVLSDGTTFRGAEAVFRLQAIAGRSLWLTAYRRVPGFAAVSEMLYRFVARHREFFSRVWPDGNVSDRHVFVRWLFLRALGAVYLIAFLSLGGQVLGLIGSQGILPAADFLKMAQERFGDQAARMIPTVFWWGAGDAVLKASCVWGAGLAVLLILDVAPAVVLTGLFVLYLSLLSVCRDFLAFQWDILLLETGFLAIFLAPGRFLPNLLGRRREAEPSRFFLWLGRWLLFRLMLSSGLVKLASGDPSWRGLSALKFHYETQPLPVWTSWFAHHFPQAVQQASVFVLFVIELLVPFFMFGPRPWRYWACGLTVALQLLLMATGNYAFFNLLTIALCLLLLDDAVFGFLKRLPAGLFSFEKGPAPFRKFIGPLGRALRVPVGVALILLSVLQLCGQFAWRQSPPGWAVSVLQAASPYRLVNTYGLFAVMTTLRREIVVEGSADGKTWLAYEFKWKPGDPSRRPRFVAPHQPRLDWQMWFAALSSYQNQPWFLNFLSRLLQGSPEVVKLLENNPFPDRPPRYLRGLGYHYYFTDADTRKKDGTWWGRELKGLYCPVVYLRQ
jgi:lipase maturation factor 1